MATPKDKRKGDNGGAAIAPDQATTPEPQADEVQDEHAGASEAPLTTAPEPQGEPGPEDFERHSGARLREDHARDLALHGEIDRRIRARADIIARKLHAAGTGATIEIGGKTYEARAKPRSNGEVMQLSEVRKRVAVSFD